jgi:hypothetical protein
MTSTILFVEGLQDAVADIAQNFCLFDRHVLHHTTVESVQAMLYVSGILDWDDCEVISWVK